MREKPADKDALLNVAQQLAHDGMQQFSW